MTPFCVLNKLIDYQNDNACTLYGRHTPTRFNHVRNVTAAQHDCSKEYFYPYSTQKPVITVTCHINPFIDESQIDCLCTQSHDSCNPGLGTSVRTLYGRESVHTVRATVVHLHLRLSQNLQTFHTPMTSFQLLLTVPTIYSSTSSTRTTRRRNSRLRLRISV